MRDAEGREDSLVLLVEDDPEALAVLTEMLQYAGATVRAAATGPEGRCLLEGRQPPLAVVADYNLPAGSGLEVLEHARRRYPDCERVLLTGRIDVGRLLDTVEEGLVTRFIGKPVDPYRFVRSMASLIDQRLNRSQAS